MFPVHDLAGAPEAAPLLTAALEAAFAQAGLEIVSELATEASLGKHRFRWVGGLDSAAARAVREDLGVDAVLLTAVEAYVPGPPPLLSLSVRLVSVADEPRILWVDGFSRSGDDSRGLLGMGAISDPQKLQKRAASELARSLARFLRREPAKPRCAPAGSFAPQLVHRTPFGSSDRQRIAVLPFLNRTNHENAGEVLALEFLGQLARSSRFEVLDPGAVRSVLLERRIIIRGGVSFDEATSVLDALDADVVLSGEVRDFEQVAGAAGTPRVEFTVRLMDRDQNVVWQSVSQNGGDDAVGLFDFGTVRTVTGLACRMAASVVKDLAAVPQATAARGRRPGRRTSGARTGALALSFRAAQRLRARSAMVRQDSLNPLQKREFHGA
jgi:TolB-like protein